MIPGNINQGRHIMAKKRKVDPVKVWFFVVLAAIFPATGLLIWVVTNGNQL